MDLARDLTILKAAPEGAAALITGVYDRKVLSDLSKNESMQRFLYLTDTLQRTCASLPDSFHPRTEAELCLLRLCDETLSGDLCALARRIEQLEQQLQNGVPAATVPHAQPRRTERPVLAAQPRYDAPPLPEEPPMPEEPHGRERVFDIPEDIPSRPATPQRTAPAPTTAAPQASAGDSSLWTRLLDQYKGRLQMNHRVFLNMASGVLEGDCLAVYCKDDFVKTSLNNATVLAVLQEVTASAVGRSVRVDLRLGTAPQAAAASKRTAAPVPATAAPQPQTPPWEEPAKSQDRLDELTATAQKLDHFKIK
jgi:DNA polymerase-3 subunit gamma/tau